MMLSTPFLANLLLLALQGAAVMASPAPPQWQHSQVERRALPSCTVASVANTTNFVLREYLVETVAGTNGSGGAQTLRGTLSVENPASGDVYRLYRIPLSTGGGVWSVCRPGQEAPLPEQLAVCQYVLERRSQRIGFRFKWSCVGEDGDAEHPLLFDATVIGELPAEVCVEKDGAEGGVVQSCSLASEAILLPVANISWEKLSAEENT